ncbi:MAG: cupin domain-containing protein [bacterium]|nr:cupin domain-containing protein [bacterium]
MKLDQSNKWEEFQDYYKQVIIDPSINKDADFLIQKVRVKPNTTAKLHYHKKQLEIFIITKNSGYFMIDDQRIEVKAGDRIQVEPLEKHTVGNDNPEELEFIAIKLNYDQKDTYSD